MILELKKLGSRYEILYYNTLVIMTENILIL